jgi:hypothetical protein
MPAGIEVTGFIRRLCARLMRILIKETLGSYESVSIGTQVSTDWAISTLPQRVDLDD